MAHSSGSWADSDEALDESYILLAGEDPAVLSGPEVLIGAAPTDGVDVDPDEYVDPTLLSITPYAVLDTTFSVESAIPDAGTETIASSLESASGPGDLMLIPEGPCCVKCVFFELDNPMDEIILDDPLIVEPISPGFLV